ncbi:integral membrane protein 2C isoform X1 [Felis catus]|uniref:Integral membrane protein 2C n=1 Tax=Felis catus TaxID=9685 RepID=A0ABI7ZPA6_FELCA|nr:integral membrane protein 2C isoform X1 [Felis catus]
MVKISFQPAVAGIKGDKADKASASASAAARAPAAEILLTPAREERPPHHRYKKGGSVGGVCYLSMGMVVLLMGLVFASVYIYRYFFLAQLARDNFFHCGVLYEDSLSSQVRTRMELEEDVKIYLEENYERINVPVPQFGGGDPADIIHDFQRGLTAYHDISLDKCYVIELNTTIVLPPRNFWELLMNVKLCSLLGRAPLQQCREQVGSPPSPSSTPRGRPDPHTCGTVGTSAWHKRKVPGDVRRARPGASGRGRRTRADGTLPEEGPTSRRRTSSRRRWWSRSTSATRRPWAPSSTTCAAGRTPTGCGAGLPGGGSTSEGPRTAMPSATSRTPSWWRPSSAGWCEGLPFQAPPLPSSFFPFWPLRPSSFPSLSLYFGPFHRRDVSPGSFPALPASLYQSRDLLRPHLFRAPRSGGQEGATGWFLGPPS